MAGNLESGLSVHGVRYYVTIVLTEPAICSALQLRPCA
jgi:hypothetical protein